MRAVPGEPGSCRFSLMPPAALLANPIIYPRRIRSRWLAPEPALRSNRTIRHGPRQRSYAAEAMVRGRGVRAQCSIRISILVAADAVVRTWLEKKLGALGQLEGAAAGAASLVRLLPPLPEIPGPSAGRDPYATDMATSGGIRLDNRHRERSPPPRQDIRSRGLSLIAWACRLVLPSP